MEATREIYWNVGHGVVIPMYYSGLCRLRLSGLGILAAPADLAPGQGARPFRPLRRSGSSVMLAESVQPGKSSPGDRRRRIPLASFSGASCCSSSARCWSWSRPTSSTRCSASTLLYGDLLQGSSRWCSIWPASSPSLMLAGSSCAASSSSPKGWRSIRDDYLMLQPALRHPHHRLPDRRGAHGRHRAAAEPRPGPLLARRPAGRRRLFAGMSDRHACSSLHKVLWWFHFAPGPRLHRAIPFTKLRHIFTTSANYLFCRPRAPRAHLPPSTWKTRASNSSARPRVTDLTWKDIFDADACTTCKRCQDRCPA